MTGERCCPGAGSMAHVRGCVNHPEHTPAPVTGETVDRLIAATRVHWVGEHSNTLHGNGAGSNDMTHTSGDEDEVTCSLCLTLLAREDVRERITPAPVTGETTDAGEGEGVHTPVDVYEMPDESAEALLRRIEDGTAVLAFRVCSECAPQEVLDRIDDGELDLSDGDALDAQWPCKFTHHPKCYQRTGVPDDLPAGLCDCKVLRMLDCSATPDADNASVGASEGLSEAERRALQAAVRAPQAVAPDMAYVYEAVERILAARTSAAATRAADDRAERIAQAAQRHRDALADTGDAYTSFHGWTLQCLWCGGRAVGKTKAEALRHMQAHYDLVLPEGADIR